MGPWLAGLAVAAAWVLPGLGHVVLRRYGRAALFAALVLGSFGIGLAHDGRLALHDPNERFLTSLQLVANLGVGPLDLAARLAVYGEPAYSVAPMSADPGVAERLATFRDRARSLESAYGTAFLWTAGLMNLLLLFDVWDIARGRHP